MEKPAKSPQAEQAPGEQMEKPAKTGKAKMEKRQYKGRKDKADKAGKEHKGKGHAYGRHKEGQSGKAYGQQRAAGAKSKEKLEKKQAVKAR